jgi:acyl carrier protein
MSEFYEGLADIFEVEPEEITPEFTWPEDAYDSLAIVSIIALIDEAFDKSVNAAALAECRSVGEIEALVKDETVEGQ